VWKSALPYSIRSTVVSAGGPALCCLSSPANARCATFSAADVPFYTCSAGNAGGFWISPGGQASIIARRDDGAGGPSFVLSLHYEDGKVIGAWWATSDFSVTLRRSFVGSDRGAVMAEFCGSRPVPVRIGLVGEGERRSCGDWIPLLDDLVLSPEATGEPH
jgi:hypothetical protein